MATIQTRAAPAAGDVRIRLEVLAWMAGMQGKAEAAARLFGAVEALHEAGSTSLPLIGVAEYRHARSAAQAQLGEARFRAAWMAGRELGPEQVMRCVTDDSTVVSQGRG